MWHILNAFITWLSAKVEFLPWISILVHSDVLSLKWGDSRLDVTVSFFSLLFTSSFSTGCGGQTIWSLLTEWQLLFSLVSSQMNGKWGSIGSSLWTWILDFLSERFQSSHRISHRIMCTESSGGTCWIFRLLGHILPPAVLASSLSLYGRWP